jgi:hypothetical protein
MGVNCHNGIEVIYEIKDGENQIGTTKFEFGDPPMGLVHGELEPSEIYCSNKNYENLAVICTDTNEIIACESVVIEDYSEEMGEQEIQVTAQLSSSEEYEKYFSHHRKTYDASFK